MSSLVLSHDPTCPRPSNIRLDYGIFTMHFTLRILEFRHMVMALHQAGWRVVLDVVYNHTFRAGPHDRSA